MRGATLIVLGALSCAQDAVFVGGPEGIGYVGALFVSDRPAGGSALHAVAGGAEIEVPSGASALLYGFHEATLELALGRPPVESLIEGALRPIDDCSPQLPAADWIEALAFEGAPSLDVNNAPAVSAGWVEARCPRWATAPMPTDFPSPILGVGIDSRCSDLRCQLESQGCSLSARLDTCVAGVRPRPGSIGADGAVCVELGSECVARDAPVGVQQSFDCLLGDTGRLCRIDLLGANAPLPAAIETLELHPGRSALGSPAGYHRGTLGFGIAWSLALLDDVIVVSSPGVGDEAHPTWNCAAAGPSILSFIDRDELTLIRTATAPRCLIDLARDPGRRGFLGLHSNGPEMLISRFDGSGRVIEAQRLAAPANAPSGVLYAPYALDTHESGKIAVALIDQTSDWNAETERSDYVVLLARDLSLMQISARLNRQIIQLRFADETTLVAMDYRGHSIRWLEVPSLRELTWASVGNLTQSAELIHFRPRGPREVILATSGNFSRFGRAGPDQENEFGLRTWPWTDAQATVGIPWPLDPVIQLVALRPDRWGGQSTTELSALAFFSAEEDRFLPVASFVGEYGFATEAETDERGRVWLLYPWSGRLLRIAPESMP